jgi:hypothetical protein
VHPMAATAVMQTMKTSSIVEILTVKFFILKQYPFGPLHVNPAATRFFPTPSCLYVSGDLHPSTCQAANLRCHPGATAGIQSRFPPTSSCHPTGRIHFLNPPRRIEWSETIKRYFGIFFAITRGG